MLKDNLKTLRKSKGLSQEELSVKLHVVRQTISKWESGLSVPDAEKLIAISELFDTPVSAILGENLPTSENNDLKAISEKLSLINEQLSAQRKQKRHHLIAFLAIVDLCMILLFAFLAVLGSPYQSWDYRDPEWSIVGTFWHAFEWIFFKIAPIAIIALTTILGIILLRRTRE